MEKSKLQEIINKYYNNIIISETAEINSFTMEREYFLDVFEIRYEVSIDMNKPIKGFREALESFSASSDQKIQSTSISDIKINIIIYSDIHFNNIFGVLNFK